VVLPFDYASTKSRETFDVSSRGGCTWQTLFSQPTTVTDSMCAAIAVYPPQTGRLCPHRHKQAEI
ncbi:uncharacterized protein K444DRAFT_543610, partial [Hyaloscypha bicolor E]